jgi:hypothetical protein
LIEWFNMRPGREIRGKERILDEKDDERAGS